MTAPLRVVDTPGDRAVRVRQVRDLRFLLAEHRERGMALASERRRLVRELHENGMSVSEIARATGHQRYDVLRLVRDARILISERPR